MASPATVETPHPDVSSVAPQWQRCRDLNNGSDAVKAATTAYLPKPTGMTDDIYNFYIQRAVYFNAFARTKAALSGAVLREAPQHEGIPDAVIDHLEDLTLRGEPLDVVAQGLLDELLEVGRHAIWLDMPASEVKDARPYWVMIPVERVINWRTTRTPQDPAKLSMIVFETSPLLDPNNEFSHETTTAYQQLALLPGDEPDTYVYRSRVWEKAADKRDFLPGPWVTPTRGGIPLDFIPFTFVGTTGITPDMTRPPLVDLADVSIAHYHNSAELEHLLYMVGMPTPVIWGANTGTGAMKMGAEAAWDLGEGGGATMLEMNGQGAKAIMDAMAAKERQMAGLGARLLDDPSAGGTETATEVRMRHSGETATLHTISAAASAALTLVMRWHVWWFARTGDMPLDVHVTLATEFFQLRATPDEVRAALFAVQAGKMSFKTFYYVLERGGWARKGVTAEDELREIESEAPPEPPEPEPGTLLPPAPGAGGVPPPPPPGAAPPPPGAAREEAA